MNKLKIFKRSLFTVVIALLLVGIIGCQTVTPIFTPEPETEEDPVEDPIDDPFSAETYNEFYEYYYDSVFDINNIKSTDGVTLYCGDTLSGYNVSYKDKLNVTVDFFEGSLTDKMQYGTVMVNNEIFGENFYDEGILDYSYYNNYNADYKYDKDGKLISVEDNVNGANIYKYYYDNDGNLKLILKNGKPFKSYIYGFEDYEIDYENSLVNYTKQPERIPQGYSNFSEFIYGDYFYYTQYNDERKELFYKYCSKELLYVQYKTGSLEYRIKENTEYIVEIDFENHMGYLYVYENNKIKYKEAGDLIVDKDFHRYLFFRVSIIECVESQQSGVLEYNYEYAGNKYLTQKTNDDGENVNVYTYEYINNYVVAETCSGTDNYSIVYIFDADFNRIGFYYNGEVFYYNINILGSVDSIINEKGEIVVKYLTNLFGDINYYMPYFLPNKIPMAISGSRKDDIGIYNSFIYKINENFMYDRYDKKYHINKDTIFDVGACSFSNPAKDAKLKSFIDDPINSFIAKQRQKQISLDTVLKEKLQSLVAESLYLEDITSYINTMVWGLSDYSRVIESESYEDEEPLTFEEFREAFLDLHPDYFKDYDLEYLLANFPIFKSEYEKWRKENPDEDINNFTMQKLYEEYLENFKNSTCFLTYREDFDIMADATGKSVGRADIFTSTQGDTGQIWGSQVYLLSKNTKHDISTAERKRQNLTSLSFIYDGEQYIMPYTGEFEFRGHFIYCNRYIIYDTDMYGIITFEIFENYRANIDQSYGNLYNYDTQKYSLLVQHTGYTGNAFTLAEIAAKAAEKTYNSLIEAEYGSFQGGVTTTGFNYYYYNEEAAEDLKNSEKKGLTIFGYDSEELQAKMAEGYYLKHVNGQSVLVEKQSKDEINFGEMLGKIAIGAGIIVVSATVIAVTAGGAAPLACFFATAATLTAVSLAGGAIAAGIDWAMGGNPPTVAESFANGFLFTAVLSSAVSLTTGMGAACFEGNTPINTQNGLKAIQDIKPFDFVLSYSHETQLTEYKRVVKTFKKEVNQTITITAGNQEITATPEHPFFANGAYVEAKYLKTGDKLKNSENQYVTVKSVKVNNLKDSIAVYNFEVEDNQNYFAGDVLVHNVCSIAKPAIPALGGAMPGSGLKSAAMLFGKIALGAISAGTLLSFNFKRVGDPIDYGRGYIPVGDLFISRFWVYTHDHFGNVYQLDGKRKVYHMAYIDQNDILQVVGRWWVPRTNPNDIFIPRIGVWGYKLNANQALTVLWLSGVYNRTIAPHITDPAYTNYGVENFEAIIYDNFNDPTVQAAFKIFAHEIPSAKAMGVYAYDPHDAMYLAMRAGLAPSVTGPTWYDSHDAWLGGGTMVEAYFISGYKQAGHFHFVDPTKSIYLWFMDPYYTAFYANKNGLQYRRNNPWTKHAFE